MALTCQHCGTEAPDDRVMCPNCRRRLRPPGEEAATATPQPSAYETVPEQGYGAPSPELSPWTAPAAVQEAGPPRPNINFARDVITKSNRVTVAFRIILAIPQIIVVWALSIAAIVIVVISWFAALFTGRVPEQLHEFLANVLRYQVRVSGYLALLTDRYPPFALNPVDYAIEYDTTQETLNRAAVLFRIILAIPAYVLGYLVTLGFYVATVISWFIVLILGRLPEPLFDAGAGVLRYLGRFYSYFLLLTPAYPAGLFREPATETYGADPAALGESSTPQPPRQTTSAKRLIVTYLVIGAAAWVTIFSVGVFNGVKQAKTLNDLRRAHNTVVRAVTLPGCPPDSGQLACLKTHAREDATSFQQFENKLSGLDVNTSATSEKARLSATTESLITGFTTLANTQTLQQYQQLSATQSVASLLNDWDNDYKALDDAVKKG